MNHILTAEQFTPEGMESTFQIADEMKALISNIEDRRALKQRHFGRDVCSFFYEPSTRTRISFEQAAQKLGASVVSTENAREFSSTVKGETLEDTISVLDRYGFDAIVMRHDETGAAEKAAAISKNTDIINGGDGTGEHPTQSLLDLYTIKNNFNTLSELNVVIGGDLKHGRTVKSLARMLTKFNGNKITFVSVPELQISDDVKTFLDDKNILYQETSDMFDALRSANVVYWTRLQKERLENPDVVPEGGFVIDAKALQVLPDDAIIMHPLPNDGEIAPEVNNDPRAKYFEQAENGLYVRMALLDQIFTSRR